MNLSLIVINNNRVSMEPYLINDFCKDVFKLNQQFYDKVGLKEPWVGYFALQEKEVVGVGGYKGAPKNGKVEVAYGTAPGNEGRGVATDICRQLTTMALAENPSLMVTARTLREESASTSILRKNGYHLFGTVEDPEDGLVWEWEFVNTFLVK